MIVLYMLLLTIVVAILINEWLYRDWEFAKRDRARAKALIRRVKRSIVSCVRGLW